MNIVQTVAPAIEPITVAELKLHLRMDTWSYVDTSTEDALLETVIEAARGHIEDITRRALLTQTMDYYLRGFPKEKAFKIPLGNLASVTHIKYKDSDSTETTMTVDTDYIVETNGDNYGRIVLPYGVTWPSFTPYTSNAITVRFVSGWTTAALVPGQIRSACLLIAADLYTNREGQVFSMAGQQYLENRTVMRLLSSHRLWSTFE